MPKSRGDGIKFLDALPEDGERRLMLAVLIDAIRTLTKPHAGTRCVHAYRLWLRERAWMESNNDSEPFSFISICHALGLDAGYVRRRVLHASSTHHGPARRYASTVKDSWLRMSTQWEPGTAVRRDDFSNRNTARGDRCHPGRCELPAAPAPAEVKVGLGTA